MKLASPFDAVRAGVTGAPTLGVSRTIAPATEEPVVVRTVTVIVVDPAPVMSVAAAATLDDPALIAGAFGLGFDFFFGNVVVVVVVDVVVDDAPGGAPTDVKRRATLLPSDTAAAPEVS